MNVRSRFLGTILRGLALTAIAAALVAGCSNGKDGATGATGATGGTGPVGPPGPTGPVTALEVTSAKTLTATITSVTGGASPVIHFTVVDQLGNPLQGLPASTISFGIVQLQPAPGDGTSTQWVSYFTSVAKPASGTTPAAWGTTNMVQPGLEGASTTGGTFTDNGDGTYTYALSQSLTAYATAATANYAANPLPTPSGGATPPTLTIAYDGTLTHRVGLEIRGTTALPTNNAVCDYLPGSATGACQTSGFTTTRYIVGNAECNACHAKLALHGGPRIDVEYCVVCHNTGNTDPSSGNSLDFKVLVHKIHMGMSLPSVVTAGTTGVTSPTQGVGYAIFGYRGSFNNFNKVLWPQDQRNCTTCHNTNDAATPDAGNYANVPYSEACTTCHDNVNTATGIGHSGSNIQATNGQCINCHGPSANVGAGLTVAGAHTIHQNVNAANYQFVLTGLAPFTDAAGTIPDPNVSCASPTTTICQIPPGDYMMATVKVLDGSGNVLTLGGPNNPGDTSAPGFDITNYMPYTSPLGSVSNPTGSCPTGTASGVSPSLTVEIALTNANFTNPGGTNATHPFPIAIKIVGFAYSCGLSGVPSYSAPTATATSGAPPAKNADGSYSRMSLRPVPATIPDGNGGVIQATDPVNGLFGINGNVAGSAFIEGRAITNIAPQGQPAQYWVTPITTAGPYAYPIMLPAGVTTAATRRVVVDINNCDKCHMKLSWHTWARNDNAQYCTVCHNPEVTTTGSVDPAVPSGPLDFKFWIHGIHSEQYKMGGHDFTSTAPTPTPTSFMNRKDADLPVLFPWTANPSLAAAGAGADCEACHVTGGNTYYPVDSAKVFATTIDAGAAVGPSDDIAITPNVAACGSCHMDLAAQSHMGQNGGVTAAMALKIKAPNGSTLPAFQSEACSVCHGPGAVADVKLMHKVATF